MLRDKPAAKDPHAIGIDALSFLAGDAALMRRFLDMTGLEADELRQEAQHPAFFVGVLDFILAHEPTAVAFAASAGLRPEEVEAAREKLAGDAT